tara:strand:+ start:133 stop:285 length:153 start_codon:yes stop_codon:yes gene_type:complete
MAEEKEKGPLDGPSIDIHSEEFKRKVFAIMVNKHNNPDEDFNLFQNSEHE